MLVALVLALALALVLALVLELTLAPGVSCRRRVTVSVRFGPHAAVATQAMDAQRAGVPVRRVSPAQMPTSSGAGRRVVGVWLHSR